MDFKALAEYDKRGGGGSLFSGEDLVDFFEEKDIHGFELFVAVFVTYFIVSTAGSLKGLL